MKELVKNFGAFSLGPIIGAMLSFITVPVTTYFISPDEYGKTSMFTVAQGMVSMFVYLGLDQAFVREFNLLKDRTSELMVNALFLPIIMVVCIDIVIISFAPNISNLLFDTDTEIPTIYLMALMFFFMIIENFALLKIRMEEKGVLYSSFTILLKLLILIITVVLFVVYEHSFRSVVYAMASAEIINGILLYFIVIKGMHLKPSYINKSLMKNMLKFGLPLIPASLLGWALTSMDKIMLRSMCTYEELGLYTAAFKIVSVLGIIQTCFVLFWTPVAYRWYEEKVDNAKFQLVMEVVAAVMSLMCFGLLLCKDIVATVLGKDFTNAIYIFPFLLLNPIMYTMSESTAIGIGFKRKTGYNILVSGIAGLINICLNYLLVPALGGKGAAIATGISYIIFFWVRTIISRYLWYQFMIKKQIAYTIIIVVNCIAHTFLENTLPYIVSLISILILLIINKKMISRSIKLMRNKEILIDMLKE